MIFKNTNIINSDIYSQSFSCNFDGQLTIATLCGYSQSTGTPNGAISGTVLNENVPNVLPIWSVTDYTSISKFSLTQTFKLK